MKRLISLVKVSLNHDMNIFQVNTMKKEKSFSKVAIPLFVTIYIMILIGFYSYKLIDMLKPVHLEFVALSLFAIGISFICLIEGIYKSGSLLFNCNDDDLLFSLPVKKEDILFVRIFKFYIFELLYNSLFILPVVVIYALKVVPGWSYYLSSFIALLLLPIIPIILSCIIGFVITYLSSKFKGKNIFQTIFSITFLLLFLYLTYSMDNFVANLIREASSINDFITKLYYPVGAYISLVTDFNIMTLIIYIIVHVIISIISIFILSKLYFRINSGFKKVLTSHKNSNYIIKRNSRGKALIKKELNKFFSTPVFITNAGFGLVLFIIVCLLCCFKFDYIVNLVGQFNKDMNIGNIRGNLPIIMFGLICFTSFMTSITSSMISLEGKAFNILKSLPLKPIQIVLYKVLSAFIIMMPCIIVGELIVFIKFKFDIISMLLIFISSLILPLVSAFIGILVNLKYPKVDAVNDTEVVKQSMSSLVATFIGMGLVGLTIISLFMLVDAGVASNIIMTIILGIYGIVCLILYLVLLHVCDDLFNNINA